MIYFDNAATTIPKKEVVDYVIDLLRNAYANPNSVNYGIGLESRKIIEDARKIIAEKINAEPEEIFFTSSASAANTLAISGYLRKNNCKNYITTNIEHSSIGNIEVDGVHKVIEKCNTDGFVTVEQFEKYNNCLVSVMACNNEIGTIQPIKDIANMVHKNNNIIHTDLTQYIPYYKVDIKELSIDMATFAAHKIHGLKGCGVLYKRKDIELSPLIFGSQEQGLFGGTEDLYSIAACGKAMELLNYKDSDRIKEMQNYLLDELLKIDGVTLNGSRENRSIGNVNICIDNIVLDNNQLSALLDLQGYCIATGSSCHSGDNKPSHVLLAIGKTPNEARHSIRITINEDNTMNEIEKFVRELKNIVEQFHK